MTRVKIFIVSSNINILNINHLFILGNNVLLCFINIIIIKNIMIKEY